ncbi:MAG TPA: tRNA pseudouridine(55) synthase TruB [Clostridia bacterium]|nr:tRNA pseudouridine(55) synthase TruB [Clostridia bacterium]
MSSNGILVIDKPSGWTSHDVVGRVRRLLGEKSVGHLGTLDPMATGVLPLVLGRMTRLAQFYGDAIKAYEGEIRFGFATDTYDAEGERADVSGAVALETLNLDSIRAAAAKFVGPLEQVPPPFSAKKINGVPAYKLARKKVEVQLKGSQVEIKEFEVLDLVGDRARFRALVSSGTYIRAIAHELGQVLGTGAHLSALRRTMVAEFTQQDARTLDQIEAAVHGATGLEDLLVHPRRVLPEMPSVTATEEQANWIRNGRAVNLPETSRAKLIKVFVGQREIIAIMSRVAGTLFHPKAVLMGSNEPVASRG